MVSSWYRDFVPMFKYTAKKYNDCDVKVFHMKQLFPGYHKSTVRALRFLLPSEYFKGYDFVYITDVDFLFVGQKPGLFSYHKHVMERTKQPYSGYRGPLSQKGKRLWSGNYGRMAGGAFMATPEWFEKTEKRRAKYLKGLKKKRIYREEDEVYLFKLCRESGFKVPKYKDCFSNNEEYCIDQRGVHLGDFKEEFRRHRRVGAMKRWFFSLRTMRWYQQLAKDKKFRILSEAARKNQFINEMFLNLNQHIKNRTIK
jgi:hypothetical protein